MIQSAKTGMYFELDPIIGWRADMFGLSPVHSAASTGGCVRCPSQNTVIGLAVDCVPGRPEKFAPALADHLVYPIALAQGGDQKKVYLLDQAVSRLKELDLEPPNQIATAPGIGGKGKGARRLRSARGLAVLADGCYVIADTGNHQVKIFSSFPHALLAVWGTGRPGNGPTEFDHPWKVVADRCGLIYIADRGNGCVQRIRRDGSAEPPIGGLQSPSGLALGSDGTLAVLDGNKVVIFASGQTTAAQTLTVQDASCLTLDSDGYLYVGTSTALLYKFAPTGTASFLDPSVGIGVTGMDAQFIDLLWTRETQLLGILLEKCVRRPLLWTLSTCATYVTDPVTPSDTAKPVGILTTETLDSGIEGCIWDRIRLDATVPAGTLIKVATQTADTDIWNPTSKAVSPAPFTPECSAFSAASQDCPLSLTGDNPDCLVQSRAGRYLRVQVQLKSNAVASPLLRGIRIYFPRESYLQYLPAIYQEDDESRVFLDRFLSIFQTTFDGIDHQVDDLWQLFDPISTPDRWYTWLASWVALPINPVWTNQQRRTALKNAGKVYPTRGTPAGVEELIKEYSGVDARLVEHFRLRQLLILPDQPSPDQPNPPTVLGSGGRLWSRDYYQRLQLGVYSRVGYFRLTGEPEPGVEPLAWGANEFTVFFDCGPYHVAETRQKVAEVVEREKPAYTKANYAAVLPRMRVGVQSTLGVDTRVGAIWPLLLGTTGTLGYDSILDCSKTETHVRSQNGTLRPQVDVNTRLL